MAYPSARAVQALIVEDDPLMAAGLYDLLQRRGIAVTKVARVADALTSIATRPPTHVLLDLTFPEDSGLSVLRYIRDGNLQVAVAVLSASTDRTVLNEMQRLAPDKVYGKPYSPSELLEWLGAAPVNGLQPR